MAVFDFFKGKGQEIPEQKASATGPVIAYHGGRACGVEPARYRIADAHRVCG